MSVFRNLPNRFKVNGRGYELVPFFKTNKKLSLRWKMRERGLELKANMGREDGEFIRDHQRDLPKKYRGKIVLVFPDWHDSNYGDILAACLSWRNGEWFQDWVVSSGWTRSELLNRCKLVRRCV